MSRLSRHAQANLTLAELSIKLTESIINLADALTLKVENMDVTEPNIDVSDKMTIREALDTVHSCSRALRVMEKLHK